MSQKTMVTFCEILFILMFDLKQHSQKLSKHMKKAGGAESQTHSQVVQIH